MKPKAIRNLTVREQYELLNSLRRSIVPCLRFAAGTEDVEFEAIDATFSMAHALGISNEIQRAVANSTLSPARYVYIPIISSPLWASIDGYRYSVGSWRVPF